MIRHRHFREMLARRTELSPADFQRLQIHLASCPECQATAIAYDQQRQMLQSMPLLQTPPQLRAGVLGRIHTAPVSSVPWYRQRTFALGPIAASLLLAVLGAVWVAKAHGPQKSPQTAALSAPTTSTPRAGAIKRGTMPSPASPLKPVHAAGGTPTRSGGSRHPHAHPPAEGRTSPTSAPPGALFPTAAASGVPATFPSAPPVPFVQAPSIAARLAPTHARASQPSNLAASTNPHSQASNARSARGVPVHVGVATSSPTAEPPHLAAGPIPTGPTPPNPVRIAPIQLTPTAGSVPSPATPVIVVTPVQVDTPLPIIPVTPTPAVAAATAPQPSTATPTPTPVSTALP